MLLTGVYDSWLLPRPTVGELNGEVGTGAATIANVHARTEAGREEGGGGAR